MSEEEKSPIFWMDHEAPEMQAAIKNAQSTYKFFWRELAWEQRRIVPALDIASVKAPFYDPGAEGDLTPAVEQMWIDDIYFDGETIHGTLLNQPHELTSVKQGDEVELFLGGISDWMYSIMGKVYGGHTVNLIRSQMGLEEREAHDEAWGLDFGDPDEIVLFPTDWDEPGTEPSLSEHPMSSNMGQSLEDFLKSDPSAANSTDQFGLTMLHSLVLAGSFTGVEVLIRHGADQSLKTSAGHTPLDLAERMNWPRLIELLKSS